MGERHVPLEVVKHADVDVVDASFGTEKKLVSKMNTASHLCGPTMIVKQQSSKRARKNNKTHNNTDVSFWLQVAKQ